MILQVSLKIILIDIAFWGTGHDRSYSARCTLQINDFLIWNTPLSSDFLLISLFSTSHIVTPQHGIAQWLKLVRITCYRKWFSVSYKCFICLLSMHQMGLKWELIVVKMGISFNVGSRKIIQQVHILLCPLTPSLRSPFLLAYAG